MLSPGVPNQKLLPEEQVLIELLGWTEEEYLWFEQQKQTYKEIRLGEPVNFPLIPFLVTLVVGVALQYVATLLAPAAAKPGTPARLEGKTVEGQSVVNSSRFAPTAGFDSDQNVVELGSVVPVIFADREVIDGVRYGGVRVNTNLLWSQLYSLGGSQLIKVLLMIGVGPIEAIAPRQTAIGDNLLGSYDLSTSDNTTGRLSLYYRSNGGRIRSTDLIAGRAADSDIANSENAGADDVFQIRGVNGNWRSRFCFAAKPSTQTTFGLYSPIGNDLAYVINPVIVPTRTASLASKGSNGDARVRTRWDTQRAAQRFKRAVHFSTRSGITALNGVDTTNSQVLNLVRGDVVRYRLLRTSDSETVFRMSSEVVGDAEETCEDVAQAVSGLQHGWDDALIVGERYKIGSAIAILEARSPLNGVFVSNADNDPPEGGTSIRADFRIVRPGIAWGTSFDRLNTDGNGDDQYSYDNPNQTEHSNATNNSHIHRLALANFSIGRASRVVEIGFKSTLSIRIRGLCNFPAAKSFEEADDIAAENFDGDTIKRGRTLQTSQYTSGTYTGPETRYSFHRIRFRIAGTNSAYTEIPQLFGFRSMTGQPTFNYIRLVMPTLERWEYEIEPISGWEIRNNIATGNLHVLDSKIQTVRKIYGAGCEIEYNGVRIDRTRRSFQIKATQSDKNLGQGALGSVGIVHKDGLSYVDGWGRLAEIFTYAELQASTDSAEHEVAYVNITTSNQTVPRYQDLALLGATIRSGPEMRNFQQISVYVNRGFGATHLIGDVLRHFLTNAVFGLGNIVSAQQIDDASFDAANDRTYDRRYFFDGAVSEPFNFRQQGAQWAEYFLEELLVRGGRFYLQPIALFDEPHPIGAMYTSGNVSEFEYTSVDPDERIPPRVTVKWREERQASDVDGRGLFPVIREVTIREVGTPSDAPIEAIDLTQFCTNEAHAIDVGKMRCRKKRLIKSRVRLVTRPSLAAFDPGKIIKIGMETLVFNSPRNGAVLDNGTVVTVPADGEPVPLEDGSYTALVWTGASDVATVTLVVADGVNTTYAPCVFSIADTELSSQTYKVQAVDFTEDGDVEVQASEFPLDADGYSLLTSGWDAEGNWVIEGAIGADADDEATVQAFQSVTIFGNESSPQGGTSSYAASIDGPSGSYTYSWTGSGVTIDSASAASTDITFPTVGEFTITCAVTLGAVTRSDTIIVQVGAVVTAPTIGTVTVSGPTTGAISTPYAYTAAISGTATDEVYAWTVIGPDEDIDPLDTDDSTTISFGLVGTYTVRARALSPTASDNPRLGQLTVVIS
jgi:hypothetical protein